MADVLIYINAGGPHGMGHFVRSAAIAEFLKLRGHQIYFTGEINEQCISVLRSKFNIFNPNEIQVSLIIIDATTVSVHFKKELNSKEKVILISPVLDFYEHITHICSRSPLINPPKIENNNIHIDPYFAFWGCGPFLKPNFKAKEKFNIGICISGSEQYVDLAKLVTQLSSLSQINVIKLISPETNLIIPSNTKRVIKSNLRNDLWKFFEDIDIFITGDGITLYEAISKGLPSFSFQRDGQNQKNAYFANHLFLQIPQIDWYTNKILDQISDRHLLHKIKSNIENANIPERSNNLGKVILKIINGDVPIE